jgi:hypothetical protein
MVDVFQHAVAARLPTSIRAPKAATHSRERLVTMGTINRCRTAIVMLTTMTEHGDIQVGAMNVTVVVEEHKQVLIRPTHNTTIITRWNLHVIARNKSKSKS